MDDQNKNLILATALSFIVILVWFVLFPPPEPVDPAALPETTAQVDPLAPVVEGQEAEIATQPTVGAAQPLEDVIAGSERIEIETDRLTGSIALTGGRIDDLSLKDYRETLDPDAELVRILSPENADSPYYALHGWIPTVGAELEDVPGRTTPWVVESGQTLSVGNDVGLVWENGAGLVFRKTFSIDEDFLFTVTQSVENASGAEIAMRPYGQVARHGEPEQIGFFIQHEGVVRMSDGSMEEINYDDMPDLEAEDGRIEIQENGWIGFSDQYWMTALIPSPGRDFRSVARHTSDIYLIETVYPMVTVANLIASTGAGSFS